MGCSRQLELQLISLFLQGDVLDLETRQSLPLLRNLVLRVFQFLLASLEIQVLHCTRLFLLHDLCIEIMYLAVPLLHLVLPLSQVIFRLVCRTLQVLLRVVQRQLESINLLAQFLFSGSVFAVVQFGYY